MVSIEATTPLCCMYVFREQLKWLDCARRRVRCSQGAASEEGRLVSGWRFGVIAVNSVTRGRQRLEAAGEAEG